MVPRLSQEPSSAMGSKGEDRECSKRCGGKYDLHSALALVNSAATKIPRTGG